MRNRLYIAWCLLACFVCFGTGTAWGQSAVASLDKSKALTQYVHEAWGIDEGLPQNSVNAVVQTEDGYLWLGTQEGLVRFDGLVFTVFNTRNVKAFRNSDVRALYVGQNGVLWIGLRDGGLVRLKDGQFTAFTTAEGLSSDHITALHEDRQGYLWVGTSDGGINRLAGEQVEQISLPTDVSGGNISALYEDADGILWVGTRDAGMVAYKEGIATVYNTASGLPTNDITALMGGHDGTLWIGTREHGLVMLKDGQLARFTTEAGLAANDIQALFTDANNTLWIGTENSGLSRYHDGLFSTFATPDGLTYDGVKTFYEDREGSLWIGTDGGGLNRLRNAKFTTFTKKEGVADDLIYGVLEDAPGSLWLGTEQGITHLQRDSVRTYTTEDGLLDNFVPAVASTPDGSIWMGSIGGGLAQFKDGQFTNYGIEDGLPDDRVFALYADPQGTLWIGTGKGLVHFVEDRFEIISIENGLSSNFVTVIAGGGGETLWVGTYDGGLNRLDAADITTYTTANGLSNNAVLAVHKDEDDVLWIGTFGGGLMRLKNGEFTNYTTREGLFNNNVFQILDDDQGNFWMSCNMGLFRVKKEELNDFAEGKTASITSISYDKTDGLKSREFNGGIQPAGWKGQDGRLWFPSSVGVAVIDPANILINTLPPKVVIENIIADDKAVSLHAGVEVPPGRDKFEFHYVGLSFVAPKKVQYRYQLEGVDEDWVTAGSRRTAFYTNLDPGTYTFRVMAQNNDGIWSEEAATFTFYLKPFFYQTRWFQILCVLSLLLMSVFGYGMRIRHLKARERELERVVEERTHDLRMEKEKTEKSKEVIEAQADKLRELDRFKTRFFANVSHEFRTPLTMIIGPLENALSGSYGQLNGSLQRQVDIMLRNALRLMRLINQLLDLSKLEAGKMQLKAHSRNIVAFLEGVLLTITPFAEKKDITLTFESEADDIELFYEPDKFEKVFYNLLSNASKFTPEGGEISIHIASKPANDEYVDGTVEIQVRDTGKGIPAEQLPYIFDRFHQVDGSNTRQHEGTGIGLSLVKEMIELHYGKVHVESEVGEGTVFVITLPKGKAHLKVDEVADSLESAASLQQERSNVGMELATADFDEVRDSGEAQVAEEQREPTEDDPLVLVVDDNADVREYVGSILGELYRIETAKDGQDGLEKAALYNPDLIISDVMMPIMDGNAMCRAIKSNDQLKHIPVIMLTARATHELKIEGLEGGADDYMAKPFNARELLARVRNLLTIREQQKNLVHLNNSLKETNRTLQQVSEVKTQVLRTAAHDMKNPLFVIREFTKIVREEVGETTEVDEFLTMIESSSDRMLRMTTQLLDSAALESGMMRLEVEAIDLVNLGEDVVRMNRTRAEAKGQTLEVKVDLEGDALVEGDRERLHEVLDNLISNAIKYSPEGKHVQVLFEQVDDEVIVSVSDEGPGLTAEDLQKVFGKFQKLSAAPTGGESSTGLGLSIVKQVVELHGGRVWVESEAGKGATFKVALKREVTVQEVPVFDETAPEEEAEQPVPERALTARVAHSDETPLVLVVDDHPDVRKFVTDILSGGYRVAMAENGQEGLDKARELEPDLVLSDVMMPVMGGFELCKAIKGDPDLKHTPVVLMTAWTTQEAKIEGLKGGADDYIAKPFNTQELLVRVENLIALRQMSRELQQFNALLQQKVEEQVDTIMLERQRYEDELITERDKAEASSRLKSAILNNMSHEFRTPVTTIMGYSRLLLKRAPEDFQEHLSTIVQNGHRLTHTLDSVLELAELETQGIKGETRRTNFGRQVRFIADSFRQDAEKKGVAMNINVPEEEAYVEVDLSSLKRLLNSLLDNAVKFTEQGEVTVSVEPAAEEVRLRIQDTGIGIGEDFMPELYKEFTQESSGLTRTHEGSGLGLAIAKRLIDAMGAEISVETQQGEGSTFTVTFPLAPEEEQEKGLNARVDRAEKSLQKPGSTTSGTPEGV